MREKIPIDDESQKMWDELKKLSLRPMLDEAALDEAIARAILGPAGPRHPPTLNCRCSNTSAEKTPGDRMCCVVSRAHRDKTYPSVVLVWGGGLVWVELNYCPTCGRKL